MISGFCHEVDEKSILLSFYALSSGARCVITQKIAVLMRCQIFMDVRKRSA
jgi:hypothetical protein